MRMMKVTDLTVKSGMIELDPKKFAELPTIKDLRYFAKLSANKIARQLDVHERTVYNWESGKHPIDLKNAYRIADLFGMGVEEINWWPELCE